MLVCSVAGEFGTTVQFGESLTVGEILSVHGFD